MAKNKHQDQEDIHKDANEQSHQDSNIESNEAFASEESLDGGEVEALNAALSEQKDKYMRLMAEFENYKRRKATEIQDINKTAGKEIVVALLDVLDDVDRAELQLEKSEDVAQIKEGISLIFNKLRKTLISKGLKEMESLHTEFDTEKHEAITQIPAPTEDLQGKVLDQVKKGYYLNDKLIRHAQVVIGQ